MNQICILCGEDLDQEKTNLEHYVPATAIRNFGRLGIPKRFNWALRVNSYQTQLLGGIEGFHSERIKGKVKEHKRWATVRVHERCNQDASHMCQDLRYIIDHLDEDFPDRKFKSILEYYAHIWGVDVNRVYAEVYSAEDTARRFKHHDLMSLYRRGKLDLGRVVVAVEDLNSLNEPGVERHFIYLGTEDAIDS